MRLLSYNIHKGIGGVDRRYRLERILEVIDHEQPDLICLQEVDNGCKRSSHHDQPRLLVEHFKAEGHCYQLNVKIKNGGYGNLLLSRWPILERHQLSLRLKWRKPRGAQLAVVDSPQGTFHLVNWHLGLAEKERQWQVAHLLTHHTFKALADLPTLIAGDFNDWRNQLAKKVFEEHEFEQATAPVSRYRSYPAYMPVASLDKAFHRGGIAVEHVKVVRSKLARQASDHLPLVIDFSVK